MEVFDDGSVNFSLHTPHESSIPHMHLTHHAIIGIGADDVLDAEVILERQIGESRPTLSQKAIDDLLWVVGDVCSPIPFSGWKGRISCSVSQCMIRPSLSKS